MQSKPLGKTESERSTLLLSECHSERRSVERSLSVFRRSQKKTLRRDRNRAALSRSDTATSRWKTNNFPSGFRKYMGSVKMSSHLFSKNYIPIPKQICTDSTGREFTICVCTTLNRLLHRNP